MQSNRDPTNSAFPAAQFSLFQQADYIFVTHVVSYSVFRVAISASAIAPNTPA